VRGCIFKRKLESGKVVWGYSIDLFTDENGKRVRPQKTGFEKKGDAEAALSVVLREKEDGSLIKPVPKTLGEFIDEWLREHAEQHCAPKTVERYRQLAAYALPHLGTVQLADLSPLILERLYGRLLKEGGRRQHRVEAGCKSEPAPLSAKTVRHVAGVIHSALNCAVRWKLIKLNPADACQLPRVERKEAKALDTDATEWFIDAARGNWLYPILVFAAATGCRRGEILALKWTDLALESDPAIAFISRSLEQTQAGLRMKTTKNGKSRPIPLPSLAVEALKAHLQQQQDDKRQFGQQYRELGLVFSSPEGDYLKPDSVTAKACLLAQKAGLKGIGLHSLRHYLPFRIMSRRRGQALFLRLTSEAAAT
jgi:integrase